MKTKNSIPLLAILWCACACSSFAQNTAFTYQGRLSDGGNLASGTYDLRFTIYDKVTSGSAVGGPLVSSSVPVSNGLFTVQLDFGAGVFNGEARWLEIAVHTNDNVSPFVTLSPRQPITAVPYALHALNAPTGGVWQVTGMNIHNANNGNVGIGDTTPLATLTVGSGDKFQVDGTQGDVSFTDDQASITFPPADADNAPMIHMFASGTQNGDRMVIAHSPGAPGWGLQYIDQDDRFRFLRAFEPIMTVALGARAVGIGTDMPAHLLHVRTGTGRAIFAEAFAPTGPSWAVYGESASSMGYGGYFRNTGGGQGLFVESGNNWRWNVGNGRGDFAIGGGSNGLSIGVSLTGTDAGTTRIWPIGGTRRIIFGDPRFGIDGVTIQEGYVAANVLDTEQLYVRSTNGNFTQASIVGRSSLSPVLSVTDLGVHRRGTNSEIRA